VSVTSEEPGRTNVETLDFSWLDVIMALILLSSSSMQNESHGSGIKRFLPDACAQNNRSLQDHHAIAHAPGLMPVAEADAPILVRRFVLINTTTTRAFTSYASLQV